jgi:tRNA(Arg) A34 adenosine deaminase TadA
MIGIQAEMKPYVRLMDMAIDEAQMSLREGNCGFGCLIVRGGDIIAKAHDTEKSAQDPTAHAELAVIRQAAALLGCNLSGCQIVSTHEPCPMCATAILWCGIDTVVYGYSIKDAIRQGRRRIDLRCTEIFQRAGKAITVHEGVLRQRCRVLYDKDVREQVDMLRNADESALCEMAVMLTQKRFAWFETHGHLIEYSSGDILHVAYEALLTKLGIAPEEAPVMEHKKGQLTFGSRNFCPTLEACKILGLDTRFVCRHLTEKPTEALLQRIDPRLRFSRDYQTLRPYGASCVETISIEE